MPMRPWKVVIITSIGTDQTADDAARKEASSPSKPLFQQCQVGVLCLLCGKLLLNQ